MRKLLCVDRDNGVNNHTGSLPIDGEHPDSGYLRITFYFYEEADWFDRWTYWKDAFYSLCNVCL